MNESVSFQTAPREADLEEIESVEAMRDRGTRFIIRSNQKKTH